MNHFITGAACTRRPKTPTRSLRLRVEQLERRDLMTATPFDASAALSNVACGCPICTGQGLTQQVDNAPPAHATTITTASAATVTTKYALSSLPRLSSSPGSTAKLVLDFNGNNLSSWGTKTNVVTSVYDIDGDTTTFSTQELANIREIWARVAEDYAPFNIDVTTVDPGVLTDKVVAKIAIGGSSSDWYGASAGGVAYIGGFYNTAPNIGFVFENNLGNGNPKYVGDAVSHEAGHLFGLSHQAKWNGTTLVTEYNPGNASWAPIMGVGYYSAVTTWTEGPKTIAPDLIQDDMEVLAGARNGFGYRANKQGSLATAGNLGTSSTISASGVIAQNTDQQWWKFTTGGGTVSLNVNTIAVGANLDSVLEIRNSAGTVLFTANSSSTLNSSLKATLAAGTYYAVVRSTGVYGYVGQYTLTGTIVPTTAAPTPTAPEVTLLSGATGVGDGGSVSFGTTQVGTAIDKTFTIRNDGNAALTLQAINTSSLPAGFSIVSNIGVTTLQAGQSTTFTVRMTATTAGTFSGAIRFNSNDANEAVYDINVSGTATAPLVPEAIVFTGAISVGDGGVVSFGTTYAGTAIDKTFTIRNDGNAALTLQAINTSSLPAGFSIVSNIGATTLKAGQTTTFTVRMTATTAGSFSGPIRFYNNDPDEAAYDINVSGTVKPATAPEITLLLGSTGVADGGTVAFETTSVGDVVDKTFTIRNDGDAVLTLQAISTWSLPAGFSIVSNIGTTTLQAGETTTFTVRMTAAAAGTFAGVIRLNSNDPNEAVYDIKVSGVVTDAVPTTPPDTTTKPPPTEASPEVTVLDGNIEIVNASTYAMFGRVYTGTVVNKTITIRNDGNTTLTLQPLQKTGIPTWLSIVSDIRVSRLSPGESTTFVVRFNAKTAGNFYGFLRFGSNDPDESSYVVKFTATAVARPTLAQELALIDDVMSQWDKRR